MSMIEKLRALPKDELNEEIFAMLNSKAIKALSESKALSLIKAAKMLGYRHHQDIPETSDDYDKLEKLSQEILDKEKTKGKTDESPRKD
jgi:hypothetical protein